MVSLVNNCIFLALSGGTGNFVVSGAVQGYQTPAAASVADGSSYRYRAQSADLSQWEIGTTVSSVNATTFTRVVTASSAGGTTLVNFSSSPTVALTVFTQDIVAYNTAGDIVVGGNVTLANNPASAAPFQFVIKRNNSNQQVPANYTSVTEQSLFQFYQNNNVSPATFDRYLDVVSSGLNSSDSSFIRLFTSNGSATLPQTVLDGRLGTVSLPLATASTSSTTGALAVTGGVGVGGAINAGGTVTARTFSAAPAAGLSRGVDVNQTGNTATLAANQDYNAINVNSDATTGSSSFETRALDVTLVTGGSTAHGQKIAIRALTDLSGGTTATAGDLIAIDAAAISSQPNGGTNTGAGAAGTLYGFSVSGHAFNGAINYFVVSGGEFDAIIDTGASSKHRWGISIVGNGAVRGASTDAAVEIGATSSAASHTYGIFFDSAHGAAPLPTTGTIIGNDGGSVTVANFADFHTYTFTGDILYFPNYRVTAAGVTKITGSDANVKSWGANSGKSVAANATLGTAIGSGLMMFNDVSVGGYALVAYDVGTGAAVIVSGSANFVTGADPGAGSSKWWVQSGGVITNRYAASHAIDYFLIGSRDGTVV